MNELITILIILAALISFLNKIFGQKKEARTREQRPESEPSLPSWFPPWLEIDTEEGPELAKRPKKTEPPTSRQVERGGSKPPLERTTAQRQPQSYLEPSPAIEVSKSDHQLLPAVKITMESMSELKRGILFAEILGPCRAKRRTHRII